MPSSSHVTSDAVFRAPKCTVRTSRKALSDLSFTALSPGSCVLKKGPPGTMPPPSDIVKVAIEWPGANAQLLEIDQKRPLASIIKEVCDGWSLPNPEYYTLRYADGPQLYVTEQASPGKPRAGQALLAVTCPRDLHTLTLTVQVAPGLDLKSCPLGSEEYTSWFPGG